jgi:hypothetical protein
MVVGVVIITQCTITLTLCINVAWCCGEPVSCVLRHPAMSVLLHCLMLTARLFPVIAGRVPRLPRWLPFPQDPHTPPPHRPLQFCGVSVFFFGFCLNLKNGSSEWWNFFSWNSLYRVSKNWEFYADFKKQTCPSDKMPPPKKVKIINIFSNISKSLFSFCNFKFFYTSTKKIVMPQDKENTFFKTISYFFGNLKLHEVQYSNFQNFCQNH